ncbi:MAG: type II toxin-antitoxin system PemK/MazF family toxin [Minisyncoccia bacterium]
MFKKIISLLGKVKTPKSGVAFRAQEIWWCSLPTETDAAAERPVLVFRTFGSTVFWGLPLGSRTVEKETPFYFLSSLRGKDRIAALSQMRTIDSSQLVRRLGKISSKQFEGVNAAIVQLLKETDPARVSKVPGKKRKAIGAVKPAAVQYARPISSPFQPIPSLSFR